MIRRLLAPLLLGLAAFAVQAQTTVPAVLRQHAAIVYAGYEDSLDGARRLQAAVAAFTRAPSASSLDGARRAWLMAREAYGQTEAFRFYGGPIDDARGPEGRINAWPLDESYIDRIVADRKQPIDKRRLARLNERGGEENIATGWHAIEYLLWGPDTSDSGPGARSFEDYVDAKQPDADRRRHYLLTVSELLIDDLAFLVRAWAPADARNYRARFERGGRESLRKLFVGLGSLSRGELAGERLEVALASRDQEDEHSCFSDNTHRDAVTNAQGIANVWFGRYTRSDGRVLEGPAPRDLVAARDSALAQRTGDAIQRSVARAQAIQPPFDREIAGGRDGQGRARIEATIASLVEQSRLLVDAAAAAGIARLTLVQPE